MLHMMHYSADCTHHLHFVTLFFRHAFLAHLICLSSCFQILECLSDPTVSQTAATAFNIILSEYPDVLHPSQHPNITSHLYKQRVFVYTFPKLHGMFKTIQPGKLIVWYNISMIINEMINLLNK